jgi:hypothetical protein
MTFAGYGVQTPNNDLLDYRQIGNVVLTVGVNEPEGGTTGLPPGVPNNINAH